MSALQAEIERVTRQASAWPVELVARTTEAGHHRGEGVGQSHLACGKCGQSVFLLSPDSSRGAYLVTTAAMNTGIAAHVRSSHPLE